MTTSEKEILLMNSDKYFNRLLVIIESVPSRKWGLSIETLERDKNFRDVVMHLYEWHAMLERWGKVWTGISRLFGHRIINVVKSGNSICELGKLPRGNIESSAEEIEVKMSIPRKARLLNDYLQHGVKFSMWHGRMINPYVSEVNGIPNNAEVV